MSFMVASPKISAVVPCFNEETWVSTVITSLLASPSIFEIIAVDDGSTDKTLEILKTFRGKIKVISFNKNHGKGAALAAGIKKAKGEIVVFFDAHLKNLKDYHIKRLTSPLIEDNASAVLGNASPFIPSFDPLWRFTGQRAYWKKSLVPYLPVMTKTKFGVEIYLNEIFKRRNVKVIKLKDLVHLAKPQKMPLSQVPRASLNQLVEMVQTLAKIKGIEPARIKEILNLRKIKSLRALKMAVEKLKNKEILKLVKDYLLSYLGE